MTPGEGANRARAREAIHERERQRVLGAKEYRLAWPLGALATAQRAILERLESLSQLEEETRSEAPKE